jgi:hypothetical protein
MLIEHNTQRTTYYKLNKKNKRNKRMADSFVVSPQHFIICRQRISLFNTNAQKFRKHSRRFKILCIICIMFLFEKTHLSIQLAYQDKTFFN